ncbi:hypothetical protein MVEN_02435100 [Mycena venus]|uniref:Peptidase C14 caspase domain-containing protein n=1 Tax=Mycena venus TaxID=2733690 RepID=A0A8H6WYK7_9AGAR|nr:hypothetical protein MVEN_02435100 [Mycena venus]
MAFNNVARNYPDRLRSPRLQSNSENSSIFAVAIGIDHYTAEGIPNLQGAVNDARAFEKFLVEDLHIPGRNIALLTDKSATHIGILSLIRSHLRDNPDILDRREATIFFFFAGHGSRVEAPEGVIAPDGQIEVICPVDERTTNGAREEVVHAIPDYVLGRVLGEIAEKGSEIIVILDCCHSGGMDRDTESARTVISDARSIPLDQDHQYWECKSDAVPYRRRSQVSYVLLAACGADEKARELKSSDGTYGGRFTTTLIPLMQQAPLEHTTWTELISSREFQDLKGQSAHCVGVRCNWPILNSKHPRTRPRSVLLTPQKRPRASKEANSSQGFRVEMGTLEGVLPATEFRAYNPKGDFLCTFFVQTVEVDHTILVGKEMPPVDIPRWSRAVASNWKSPPLLVYTPLEFAHTASLFPSTSAACSPKFAQAASLEEAHMIVRNEGDEIIIAPSTSEMLSCGRGTRFPVGNPMHLPEAIAGIAHFEYLFACCNKVDRLEGIELEMHRLQGEYPRCKPDPSIGHDRNVVSNGEVQLVSEKGAKYGFEIRNTSSEDLFPYLFYLDPQTFTIEQWYSPAGAPLQSGGIVTLGMGSDRAFEFALSPGELSSSGFLKLFVTDEYIELGRIQQIVSPLDERFEGIAGRLRPLHESLDFGSMRWDVLTVALTVAAESDGNIPKN